MNSNIKKNRLILAIITITLVGLIGIGMSYAYWRSTVIQDKTNVGASKCFSIELANQANEINLTNAYPITDAEGRKLTPYTFTLKNTCSMAAKYNLNMEMLSGTTLNSGYVAVLVNNNDIRLLSSYNAATTVIEGSTESRTLDIGLLEGNSSKDYSISLWIDEDVTLEDDILNKVFKSKIVIDAVATEESALDVAMEKIIASVDTTGKCPTINSDGTVDASENDSADGYLCTAPDAYGDSYYYRGNVTNNYVKFGKWSDNVEPLSYQNQDGDLFPSLAACEQTSGVGTCTVITNAGKDMYWRIIRINGDGTVRAIYDGTSAYAIGESSWDRQIGFSAFNDYWKKDNAQETTNLKTYGDNAEVGYMYGNRDSIVEDTASYYSDSFTNTNTYYIAKEYTLDESTKKFTLKNPIAVLGSAMTSDYVGYYTFGSTSTSPDTSNSYVYKIFDVTAGDSRASIEYGRVWHYTSSKEVAQTNTNDSTIKTYIDNWYKTNISGTENEQYLADNIFCNDRSLSTSGGPTISITNNFYSVRRLSSIKSSLGAGGTETWYNFYDSASQRKFDLRCPQQNDAFTVSDTKIGNGALRYPVGLINATEVILAGGWFCTGGTSRGYYLQSGSDYWTLTPYSFYNEDANVRGVDSDGELCGSFSGAEVDYPSGVRPVINLKAEILAQGSGTAEDPYHLSS